MKRDDGNKLSELTSSDENKAQEKKKKLTMWGIIKTSVQSPHKITTAEDKLTCHLFWICPQGILSIYHQQWGIEEVLQAAK